MGNWLFTIRMTVVSFLNRNVQIEIGRDQAMKDITIKLDSGREIVLTFDEAQALYYELRGRFDTVSVSSVWVETEQPLSTVTATPGRKVIIRHSWTEDDGRTTSG